MIDGRRNQEGLNEDQIRYCMLAWDLVREGLDIPLDISEATISGSKTRFNEDRNTVILGADVYPGSNSIDANSSMSVLACLAHERAHFERFRDGYRRPLVLPDVLLDEAEASLAAAFFTFLGPEDRSDLATDAHDRIAKWLSLEGR
jgi:hypothetical protein